ncbi:Dihydrolipoyllysine-residue (2-methylpropanoyl)transferase [Scedosporium apiospermum]|uniref:dihydrolipoyllysine-residue succinyltransferase n=1 Tax=Pseudallescheria apiosperma TaxID=563466 RepID=A0A084G8F7_PSEDA|nr:Dihydrolipoyllysine-residue (2-methylpropanoyl)transferase [Scedosporium apiospermum]KEZ43619.1 Dihydrolipoyllysine-residue (2-methylpropanoyl)transferase [Scedosporium apiospermum]
MLSRRLVKLAYLGQLPRARCQYNLPVMMHQARSYAAAITIKVPQMAESISEGTLKQFTKQVGDFVEQDEEIATIETDKIDVAVNAPEAGTIKELLVNEEDTVIVGQDLVRLEPGSSGVGTGAKPAAEPRDSESQTQATPATEAPARQPESDVQVQQAQHQPPSSKTANEPAQSVPRAAAASTPTSPASRPSETAISSTGSIPGSREERRVKMNRMRLRIAERLKQSQNTAASLTTFNEVDMSSLMDFRKLYKEDVLKKTGVKLGFMGAFSRACVLAMRDIPAVNASIEGPNSGDTIVYRDYVDISVAVATEKGLVTPVVRNAEAMDIVTIEQSIAELGKKARDGKLTIEDMAGGTFTISNGGVFGSLMGTPIINLPQTAVLGLHAIKERAVAVNGKVEARDGKLTIEDMAGGTFTISNGGVFGSLMGTPIINLPQTAVLGLHAIKERAVAVNGKVEVRPMMYLALTYDHRLLDGREAVQFLVKVKEYIEDPRRMLL